jgi:acyl-CoA dehydrogenase
VNFDDTPEEAAFRARARQWIADNAPHELADELRASTEGKLRLTSVDPLVAARDWQRKKSEAGWATPHWSVEYGGGGLSSIQRVIWSEEEGIYAKLSQHFLIGVGMCGPTMMAWASEARKRERLPKLSSGEEIWCQLFSEPAAGSDLAGIRTRAVRDGDDWVINGQKIWTSYAREAAWGLLITRTDPAVAKHRGLTMFFLDMRSPGVEVRPIRQMNNEASFNEVFFTDVRIPDAQRLGAPGQGWEVALTTLMNERATLAGRVDTGFDELLDFCERLETGSNRRAIDDTRARSRLAQFAIRDSGLRFTAFRSISALSRGERPGPENSIGKLVSAAMEQEMAQFALDLEGEAGLLADPALAPDRARFQSILLRSPSMRIAGGSDEILRNIIAERVLGLPADIRADKDVAFEDIPTAATARHG